MSDRPTFAVVIPTYNRAIRLVNTLGTVFRQEEPAKEIIVVDDCSNDETAEIMAELAETHTNLRYFRHEENLERAASRNTGMSNATADYVTFLDSDDLMYPRNLSEAGDFVLETDAMFFHNLYEMVDETGKRLSYGPAPRLNSQIRALAVGNFLGCIGTFIHRDIYTEYRFDPIQPTGASAIHLRRAYRLLPSSLASFLAMRAFAGYLSGSGSMTAVPSRASDTYPSMSRSFRACRFGSLQ